MLCLNQKIFFDMLLPCLGSVIHVLARACIGESTVMANIKSQEKRIRTSERDRLKNISVKSRMKTYVKQAMAAIESKDAGKVKTTVPEALSEIDRAVSKGVIHANSGARKKSTLQRLAGSL